MLDAYSFNVLPRRCFDRIEDGVASRGLSLSDCLMSGLAIFSMKHPSLPQFEQDTRGMGEACDSLRRENRAVCSNILHCIPEIRSDVRREKIVEGH